MIRLFFEHGARLDEDPQLWQFETMPGPAGDPIRRAAQEARQRQAR